MGAPMAAVVSLHAKAFGVSAKISGLYLGAGAFIADRLPVGNVDQYRSRKDERCLRSPILDDKTSKLFAGCYAADTLSPYYRVCNEPSDDAHASQPRVYFQACGMDIFRDDSLIYEDILRSKAVDKRLDIYPGTPDLFWNVFQPGSIPQSTKWEKDAEAGCAWLLKRN